MNQAQDLLQSLEHLTRQKLGRYPESSLLERDAALSVNDSLGEVVDFDNLTRLRQWMRDSAPPT